MKWNSFVVLMKFPKWENRHVEIDLISAHLSDISSNSWRTVEAKQLKSDNGDLCCQRRLPQRLYRRLNRYTLRYPVILQSMYLRAYLKNLFYAFSCKIIVFYCFFFAKMFVFIEVEGLGYFLFCFIRSGILLK